MIGGDCMYLFEMANLRTPTTGQPFEFWVDEVGSERKVEHNLPRFKVRANGVELVILLMTYKATILNNNDRQIRQFRYGKQATQFVLDFAEPLRMHWNGAIDTGQLSAIMRLVSKQGYSVKDATDKVLSDDY